MKEYYRNKSKKKKQPKSMEKKFEDGMDCKLRDLLLNTYFYGVCKNYCRQQIIVYCWVRDKLNPVIKSHHSIDTERKGTRFADTIETDFHLDQDEYPVYLDEETCKIVHISSKRTHYNFELVFSGTTKDKVIGELTFESVKNKKEQNRATQQMYEKLTSSNIVTKIIKE